MTTLHVTHRFWYTAISVERKHEGVSSPTLFTGSGTVRGLAFPQSQNDSRYRGSHNAATKDTRERRLPELLQRVAIMMGQVCLRRVGVF